MPMCRAPLLLVVLSLSAIVSAGAQTTRPSSSCARTGEYVHVASDGDTIGVSAVTVTDTSFESVSRAVSQNARVRYRGHRGTDGDVRDLHIEVWPPQLDTAGPPAQIVDLQVQAADVIARVASPARGMQMQHDRLPPGGVLYMANAPVFLELLQRHVHVAVGAMATVPALWLFTGGAIDTVRVTRPTADSLILRFPDTEYHLRIAPDGSIYGGTSRPMTADKDNLSARLSRRDCR